MYVGWGLGDVCVSISTHSEGSQGEQHGQGDVVHNAHIVHDDGETGLKKPQVVTMAT